MPKQRLLTAAITILVLGAAVHAAEITVGPTGDYTTIQEAVDAAVTGDDLVIDAGTYVEQVLVTGKDLTITGAGAGSTVIESPTALTVFDTGAFDHRPVVRISGADVSLADLTIDGNGQGDANAGFLGVDFHNAGGSLDNVTITGVRDEPLSSTAHGIGLYLEIGDVTARTLAVTDCLVTDFQKAGASITTIDGTTLTLSITSSEFVGAGSITTLAQSGVEVVGADIAATIDGNTVRDLAWDDLADGSATGLILNGCTGQITNNTITACQTGAWLRLAPMTVTGNAIDVPRVAGFGNGLVVDNYVGIVLAGPSALTRAPLSYLPINAGAGAGRATIGHTITGNTISIDDAVTDNTDCRGLWAINEEGNDDLSVTATGNTYQGLDVAVELSENAPTDGFFEAFDVSGSQFFTCESGVINPTTLEVMAVNSWWGDPAGPGGDGPGNGAAATGSIDYDPWTTDLVNLIYTPDPLVLTAAAPSGVVVFEYTGGASALIYGYSIDVQWGTEVATADRVAFEPPLSGPFSSSQVFITQDIDEGHVRIDATVASDNPGVLAAPLFQATFTGAASAEGVETSFNVTVVTLYDDQIDPITGLLPDLDPEPEIVADIVGPVVQDVLVTDTTLVSTDYTRDGHEITVTATVLEGDIATLTCDLTEFGGLVLDISEADFDGDNVYTWTLAEVSGSANGLIYATVTCVDGQAQSATLSDDILADNLPPAAVTDLVVAPGHEKIHLSWTEPVPDAGAPLAGVMFRYVTWGGSPHYVGAPPEPPTTATEGTPAGPDPVAGSAWDWLIETREVYAIAGFVIDAAGNASPTGASGLATNYWLGDSDASGQVEVNPDVNALGMSYGRSFGEDGYNGDVDVGPTLTGNPRGIPNPQADGFQVQFEDMMIMSLNLGTVGPDAEFAPGETPDMHWEQTDENSWLLTLTRPCSGLKGVHLTAELPDGVSCSVAAGALLDDQSAPVFLRNIPSRGLDTGLCVFGAGDQIEGSGELLRVVTSEPVSDLSPVISARDLTNTEHLVALPQVTAAEIPAVHSLGRNSPNPFNPATTIVYELPRADRVRLDVYAIDGRLVRRLVDTDLTAGRYQASWNGRDEAGRRVATGAYFYLLQAGDFRQVRKMMLVK